MTPKVHMSVGKDTKSKLTTSGARNSGVLKLRAFPRPVSESQEERTFIFKVIFERAATNAHNKAPNTQSCGERRHYLLTSPKSIIFTWWPVRFTQRIFSGCKHQINHWLLFLQQHTYGCLWVMVGLTTLCFKWLLKCLAFVTVVSLEI